MNSTGARPEPGDADLPGFDELMYCPVPGPVAALYETRGSTIESVSPIQASWRPGRQLTMRFRVQGGEGPLAGSNDVVATIGRLPEGAMRVEGPDSTVGLWLASDDPTLPGLRSALHPPTVRKLLADLGAEADGEVRCRLRSYRPGRRAVVEVGVGTSSRVFLKVVPPSEVEGLHQRHRHLADLLPVPDSLGLARSLGIVVMRAMPGTDLRNALRRGDAPIPRAHAIAAIVDNLPTPPQDWEAASPTGMVSVVVDLLGRLLPEEQDRLDLIEQAVESTARGSRVPVHGDFHEAQILIDAGRPAGLIDVDTFGWGHQGDDAATMLGHLHLLAPGCRVPQQTIELARGLNQLWDTVLDPVELRLRTAAVVLGLATGPFRVQSPGWPDDTRARIDAAVQWVESAHKVDERSLIPASGTSHAGPS